MTLNERILNKLEIRISKAEVRYKNAIKNFGMDSKEVCGPVEEAIYLRNWWILYVQGCTQVWFMPWYFFKASSDYLTWRTLNQEIIFNKALKWN